MEIIPIAGGIMLIFAIIMIFVNNYLEKRSIKKSH